LKITYIELYKQPAFWVESMIEYYQEKARAEEFDSKRQQARMKAKQKGAKFNRH